MAGGKSFKDGPEFILSTVGNIYNPAANTIAKIYHIHVANTNASSRTVSLWVGATGGSANGTELIEGHTIAAAGSTTADDFYDLYFPSGLTLTSSDFLTAQSSVDGTSLVITTTGELFAA